MNIQHTPDRSNETVPDEWCDGYDAVNPVAQAYIDWMNGELTKAEYMAVKHNHD